jgi:hypothetical protein
MALLHGGRVTMMRGSGRQATSHRKSAQPDSTWHRVSPQAMQAHAVAAIPADPKLRAGASPARVLSCQVGRRGSALAAAAIAIPSNEHAPPATGTGQSAPGSGAPIHVGARGSVVVVMGWDGHDDQPVSSCAPLPSLGLAVLCSALADQIPRNSAQRVLHNTQTTLRAETLLPRSAQPPQRGCDRLISLRAISVHSSPALRSRPPPWPREPREHGPRCYSTLARLQRPREAPNVLGTVSSGRESPRHVACGRSNHVYLHTEYTRIVAGPRPMQPRAQQRERAPCIALLKRLSWGDP